MANEAVIIELTNGGNPIMMTCAAGTAITKGTLLKLTDNRTVAAAAGGTSNGDPFGGIAAADKVAADLSTEISVWTTGIFDLLAASGAAITAGQLVRTSGANNYITGVLASGAEFQTMLSGGCFMGRALESTAAGTQEIIAVAVDFFGGGA
jgi:hypothetical protein